MRRPERAQAAADAGRYSERELGQITERLDAREFFRKHYGPAVKTRVIATEEFTLGCVEAGSYTVAEDGLSVTVSWGSGGSEEPGYFEVTEYPDRVEIGVVDRLYNGPQNDDARTDAKPATLRKRSRSARVGAATVPLAQLDALEDTIQKSLETSREFDAFHVLGAQIDRVTGTVIVSLVTSRTDHAAYFSAKYGPLVRTEVVAERYECYLADRRFG